MKGTVFSPHEEIFIQHLKVNKKHNMSVQHYHDGYEIYFQLDGKRYLFYDNICYTLERGDMAIFKPFDIHYAQSREADYYERYVLNFKENALRLVLSESELKILLEEINGCVIHLNDEQTLELCGYFKRADEYLKQNGFFADKLLCTAVFQLIIKAVEYTKGNIVVTGKKIEPGIIKAIKYIG